MANIDFNKELEERSLLALSVLSAETEIIQRIVGDKAYDSKNLDLSIKVNGVEVRNESFKAFLDVLYADLKEQVVDPEEERIGRLVKELLLDKLAEVMQSL